MSSVWCPLGTILQSLMSSRDITSEPKSQLNHWASGHETLISNSAQCLNQLLPKEKRSRQWLIWSPKNPYNQNLKPAVPLHKAFKKDCVLPIRSHDKNVHVHNQAPKQNNQEIRLSKDNSHNTNARGPENLHQLWTKTRKSRIRTKKHHQLRLEQKKIRNQDINDTNFLKYIFNRTPT